MACGWAVAVRGWEAVVHGRERSGGGRTMDVLAEREEGDNGE
jgi:hypothetical protein